MLPFITANAYQNYPSRGSTVRLVSTSTAKMISLQDSLNACTSFFLVQTFFLYIFDALYQYLSSQAVLSSQKKGYGASMFHRT